MFWFLVFFFFSCVRLADAMAATNTLFVTIFDVPNIFSSLFSPKAEESRDHSLLEKGFSFLLEKHSETKVRSFIFLHYVFVFMLQKCIMGSSLFGL